MFAIAFDLVVADIRKHYRKSVTSAYTEVGKTLAPYGFEWLQGSVYVTRNPDLANLTMAMLALKALPWFPRCTRDIRGFKVENWSNFNPVIKG